MEREWQVDDEALKRSKIHQLIVRLQFPLVYTTNYDHLLERAFSLHGQRFNKTITAKDIARADPSLPTIVKFHGDLDDEGSLVVTETDYFRRLAFEEPLDIKLTADAKSLLAFGIVKSTMPSAPPATPPTTRPRSGNRPRAPSS